MTPEVGLVIRHIYLWRDEHKRGQIEGRKARPCLIIHKRLNKYGETEVLVCPITHTLPETSGQSIEIPLATKQRLKLDNQRSWIITNEVNLFKWKGPDVRETQTGEHAYGYLPHRLIQTAIKQVINNARERRLGIVKRVHEPEPAYS
ncbi:MAG: type II toxin-antitoxin system PemK/MazF family toxin [Gammaproteobacteria bacterium]|nr:type II toxin-antitoxin system PemK/MazF family toxin [Gammaproteobacteria bacterium]